MKITIIVIIIVIMTIAAIIIAIIISYYIVKICGIYKNCVLKTCDQKHHQVKCCDNSWVNKFYSIYKLDSQENWIKLK